MNPEKSVILVSTAEDNNWWLAKAVNLSGEESCHKGVQQLLADSFVCCNRMGNHIISKDMCNIPLVLF
jgi:hypothetical protein